MLVDALVTDATRAVLAGRAVTTANATATTNTPPRPATPAIMLVILRPFDLGDAAPQEDGGSTERPIGR